MRVLIVARGVPTKKYPLNGVFEFDQAKALYNENVDVTFAFLDLRSIRRFRKFGLSVKKTDNINVIGYSIPLGKLPKFIINPLRIYFMSRFLKKVKKRYGRFDLIHAHFL